MESLSQRFATLPNAEVVVNVLAGQSSRLPSAVPFTDIESAAWLAYHRFMDGDGASLEGGELARHIYVIVRRAVIDELRRTDPLCRHTRRVARRLKQARDDLQLSLGRDPSLSELAKAADVTEIVARRVLDKAAAEWAEANHGAMDLMSLQDSACDAGEDVSSIGVASLLDQELAKLPLPAQRIIRRTILDEVPVSDLAKEEGRSAYHIVQIRDRALKTLRESAALRELLPR